MKKFLLSALILLSLTATYAQTDFNPKSSFKVEVGLPNNATNFAFRDLMQGLVAITPSYQFTMDNSFSLGVGLRYGFFNVNEFKNNIDMSGGMHIAGIFGKIGQEKFYGKFGLDYGVRIGYSMNFFDTNKNQEKLGEPYQNDGGFVEPTLGLALMSNENTSFRLALGYAFHGFQFSPYQMGVDNFSGVSDSKLNEITTYFTIGFGYSYYF
ncbi:hypothetical protein CW751_10370 [Brumimicrobium salinarum]|uniref:Outer membrane protein beta-barrel domain-containing protein n=1 Tax=Brumimicrobium salinarum TaxID=2058658 RepID=A0A2I0R0Z7_9FLAO|nr:hypothetical protein [Brumimicrobium salinarum]PKR80253.1 hypothetical protein CW751_10370 [Brumimicrobium salinarum]